MHSTFTVQPGNLQPIREKKVYNVCVKKNGMFHPSQKVRFLSYTHGSERKCTRRKHYGRQKQTGFLLMMTSKLLVGIPRIPPSHQVILLWYPRIHPAVQVLSNAGVTHSSILLPYVPKCRLIGNWQPKSSYISKVKVGLLHYRERTGAIYRNV